MIKYGNLTLKIGDEIIIDLDISVKNDIRKKEIFDYFKQLIFSFDMMFLEDFWK